MEVGDIIVFKGQGLLFQCLSRLLKIFERGWDRWGWHTAFVSRNDDGVPIIFEALAGGVQENPLPKGREYRVYHWFDSPVDPQDFVKKHTGEKYDILVYPLTAIAYLVRHFLHRPVPRLFDNSWSCWELVYYFCNRMGKPLAESYDFPMISDMMRKLKHK